MREPFGKQNLFLINCKVSFIRILHEATEEINYLSSYIPKYHLLPLTLPLIMPCLLPLLPLLLPGLLLFILVQRYHVLLRILMLWKDL